MSKRLTTEDARLSLTAHVAEKGARLREKYGPRIGWTELLALLQDRAYVRYPCEIVFDSAPLQPGEFAFPSPNGPRPEDGFTMYVDPIFKNQLERVAWLVLYQLVAMNYGPFASAEDAEVFGASALGVSTEEYYSSLCEMAAQVYGTRQAGCGGGGPQPAPDLRRITS